MTKVTLPDNFSDRSAETDRKRPAKLFYSKTILKIVLFGTDTKRLAKPFYSKMIFKIVLFGTDTKRLEKPFYSKTPKT